MTEDVEPGAPPRTPGAFPNASTISHPPNRIYLEAMRRPAERALARGRLRSRPALPGLIGRWFVSSLEPPANRWFPMRAPRAIRPRRAPALHDASREFFAVHGQARSFLERFAGIDLAGVRFPNPFVRGVRFSLATGLHVIDAHDRRHLWQAWNVRRAAEAADGRGRSAAERHAAALTSSAAPGSRHPAGQLTTPRARVPTGATYSLGAT